MICTTLIYKKRKKYKYILHQDFYFKTNIIPCRIKSEGLFRINKEGLLEIFPGYSWDGPSGPTIDTCSFMIGSLVHDALYQLSREGYICREDRKKIDILLKEICIRDGMFKFRAWIVYYCVRLFGRKYAEFKSDTNIIMFGIKIN